MNPITALFYVFSAVLLLAANTAFNGFPLLGSVLAKDSYAPKSLSTASPADPSHRMLWA